MKAEPLGMLWMMPKAWRNTLPGLLWRARNDLPEGRLAARMNEFTLLDDAVWGFGGTAAEAWESETDRQQQLVGVHHSGGERRDLSGAGEGPTEAGAGTKQDAWNGPTQARVRNKMRNNGLRFAFGHASVALRSSSKVRIGQA